MPAETPNWIEVVADLGRRGIMGADLDSLLTHSVEAIARELRVEFSCVLELLPDGRAQFAAGVGWKEGVVGSGFRSP